MPIDKHGREIPDTTPLSVPLDCRKPPSLQDEIARFFNQQLSMRAEAAGRETFQESCDFEVEDDLYPPASEYELDDDVPDRFDKDFYQPSKNPSEDSDPSKGNGPSKPEDSGPKGPENDSEESIEDKVEPVDGEKK